MIEIGNQRLFLEVIFAGLMVRGEVPAGVQAPSSVKPQPIASAKRECLTSRKPTNGSSFGRAEDQLVNSQRRGHWQVG